MTEQERYFKMVELSTKVLEKEQLNMEIVDLELELKIGEAENEKVAD